MSLARLWRLWRLWRESLRWKLVAVLVAVSVVPMLITSQIAASAVSATYTENVESWLFQITRFFTTSIARGGDEAVPVIRGFVTRHHLDRIVAAARAGSAPARDEPHLLDALGYDILTVREPDGHLLYTSRPFDSLTRLPFENGRDVYLFRGGGQLILATGGEERVDSAGGPVEVFVGNFLDAAFIEDINTIGSLGLTLFYDIDGAFRAVYDSGGKGNAAVPDAETLARLAALPPGRYLDSPWSGTGSAIGVLAPIKAGDRLVGVVACSFDIDLGGRPLLGSPWLLLGTIFATGMALAVVAGIALSGFLTRRVGRLGRGVDAVARGDFSQHIPVTGGDELDRLALAFNTMAAQLQDYRLLQARLRRKERFATLGEVAAGFAHEVRNPLGIIKTTAELVQRGPHLSEADARRLGYVAEEVRRIDRLIRDFLIFARPAQRTSEIRPAELVARVLGFCGEEIAARGVALEVEDRSGEARLAVDLDQMVQAFLNLILNALDAMAGVAGGRLRIAIAPAPDKALAVTVTDNGPGIAPDLLERIFDPFVTTKQTGTGLGLATVFAIVESHGGWIEARNAPGGGAAFELTLPLAGAPAGGTVRHGA
ncbi:hypothetical protein GCM10011390_24220 [Aureimonas endophytica]|uniref:histidine kinase n=1 Tax=Aureimonas endophytica TaxID=2027858 RepID=A0A916ZMU7_9HYPH|nr:HAMP domain-containing sensor histidine kinase [Aureimonas endophytica]GGE04446.1 hypothetical protein GCM10011390_24220 [Aureimonas endophytica]